MPYISQRLDKEQVFKQFEEYWCKDHKPSQEILDRTTRGEIESSSMSDPGADWNSIILYDEYSEIYRTEKIEGF